MYRYILEMRCSQITEHLSSRASGGKKLRLNLDLGGFLKGLTGFGDYESRELTSPLEQSLPSPRVPMQLQHSNPPHKQVATAFFKSPCSCPALLQRLISLLQDKCSLCSYRHCIKRPIRSLHLSQGQCKIFPNIYFPVLCPGF